MLSTGDVAWMSRVGRLAAACAMIILAQAPWTLYNLDRFDKPVILSTGFGFTAQAGAVIRRSTATDSAHLIQRSGSYLHFHEEIGCETVP